MKVLPAAALILSLLLPAWVVAEPASGQGLASLSDCILSLPTQPWDYEENGIPLDVSECKRMDKPLRVHRTLSISLSTGGGDGAKGSDGCEVTVVSDLGQVTLRCAALKAPPVQDEQDEEAPPAQEDDEDWVPDNDPASPTRQPASGPASRDSGGPGLKVPVPEDWLHPFTLQTSGNSLVDPGSFQSLGPRLGRTSSLVILDAYLFAEVLVDLRSCASTTRTILQVNATLPEDGAWEGTPYAGRTIQTPLGPVNAPIPFTLFTPGHVPAACLERLDDASTGANAETGRPDDSVVPGDAGNPGVADSGATTAQALAFLLPLAHETLLRALVDGTATLQAVPEADPETGGAAPEAAGPSGTVGATSDDGASEAEGTLESALSARERAEKPLDDTKGQVGSFDTALWTRGSNHPHRAGLEGGATAHYGNETLLSEQYAFFIPPSSPAPRSSLEDWLPGPQRAGRSASSLHPVFVPVSVDPPGTAAPDGAARAGAGAPGEDVILHPHALRATPGSAAPATVATIAVAALSALALLAAALSLYSRIQREVTLKNRTRREILERIQAHPGLLANDIAQDLGLALNTVLYHLRILKRERFVATRKVASQMRYFTTGTESGRDVVETLARATPSARLLEAIRTSPGISLQDAALAAGVGYKNAHYHVKRLTRDGGITGTREGPNLRLYPTGE